MHANNNILSSRFTFYEKIIIFSAMWVEISVSSAVSLPPMGPTTFLIFYDIRITILFTLNSFHPTILSRVVVVTIMYLLECTFFISTFYGVCKMYECTCKAKPDSLRCLGAVQVITLAKKYFMKISCKLSKLSKPSSSHSFIYLFKKYFFIQFKN